jgi:succinate-semialdehyde dehydrogenase/glutarate-semialdehyde dehydrogenase
VFNVVTGDARTVGGELTGNDTVRKLSFTGSTEVGKILLKQCADTVKKVSMELGGHAPLIIFDDADLDAAVAGAMASKFRNAGQTCVCANRILVQDGIHDAFVERFARETQALRVGDGFDEAVEQGPLIDDRALTKVREHVADAVAHGAEVVVGGRGHALGGTFYEPTVLTGATADMRIAVEGSSTSASTGSARR